MKYLIANWKMKLTIAESVELAYSAKELMTSNEYTNVRVVLCPSYTALPEVAEALKGSGILLGAQDVASQDRASLTGCVSPLQLKELGVAMVIVGHSERRIQLGETDEMIRDKVRHALANGFYVTLCIGESIQARERGETAAVLRQQLRAAVKAGEDITKLLIAYEPVWAIGAGKPVKEEEAYGEARFIQEELRLIGWPHEHVRHIPILYGGSVDGATIAAFTRPPLAGTLVGNASQTPDRFKALIEGLIG